MKKKWLNVYLFPSLLVTATMIGTGCQTTQSGTKHVATENRRLSKQELEAWNNDESIGQLSMIPRIAASGKPRLEPTRPHAVKKVEMDEPILDDLMEDVVQPSEDTQKPYAAVDTSTRYTVKKGDSLWLIAKKNNVSIDQLVAMNGLTKNAVLKVGQEITIPKRLDDMNTMQSEAMPVENLETYVVQPNDSLSVVAMVSGMKIDTLKSINKLQKETIYVGQKLQVTQGTSDKMMQYRRTHVSNTTVPEKIIGETYTVKPGQTLSDIALITHMRVAELMELNNITDPRKLRAGQVLKVNGPVTVQETVSVVKVQNDADMQEEVFDEQPEPIKVENASEDDDIFTGTGEVPLVPVEQVNQ